MTIDPAKSIPAFYAGQSILLTGPTGFLGKIFIEKILRSCPDVCEIFLLLRPKKGLSINQRLEEMLDLPLWERLRNERPSSFEKLVPISGNLNEKGLNLSAADRKILTERVTIIIHAAASVRFNNSLKYAIFSNTRATRDVCILAQSMKSLKALVYVSTAFAHVNVPVIEEIVYPPTADWQKIIKITESLDEHTLNIFTAKCLDYSPNTYIFSKNLGESIIQEYSSSLPCLIIRPSMVMPTLKEPIPGWIDNIYGPIGLFIGGGKGLVRVAFSRKSANHDVVPVDIVIKYIIVATWKLGLTTFTAGTPLVVNCINQKCLSLQGVITLLFSTENEIPLEGIVWTPHTMLIENFILFYILTILLHILPAILIDMILHLSGRRRMLVRLQRTLYVVNSAVSYFSLRGWKYIDKNRFALMSSIPPNDLDMFCFDYSSVDVREYSKNSAIGGKKFLLHEDVNCMDAARAHYKRVYLFVTMVKTVIYIGVLWIMYKLFYSNTL